MSRHGPDPRRMALHDLEHAAQDIARSPEMAVLMAPLAYADDAMRTEAAGITIGVYLANPMTKYRHELLAAGLLVGARSLDHRDLDRWIREGFIRAQGGAQSDPERVAWFRALSRD